ncbi:unnamed protein product [Clonostachys rhizophaga]|uniref:Xylanolytic transcriptional activator regulatory domain-containing protein n=1 Tax=Clonostachys rhizophaga TaxID=160324 RepID=A0A9N9VRF4_9HYPO|nr:unnamed protein product [Clonostachys rhizophaga]
MLDAFSKAQDPANQGAQKARVGEWPGLSDRYKIPSEALCLTFTDAYLSDTHLLHPILARHEVCALRDKVLPFVTQDAVELARLKSSEATAPNGVRTSRRDFFQAFLIFAIGCATVGNRPLSYPRTQNFAIIIPDPKAAVLSLYKSAMLFSDDTIVVPGLDACRSLLLLARLSTLCRTRLSVWETSRICLAMRGSISPFEEQMRRRVFWDCYKLDCYSSSTLGRPVGIPDADIEVQLPCDLDDGVIMGLQALPDESHLHSPSITTSEMSVFIHSVRMRRITSELNRSLNQEQDFITGVGLSSTKTAGDAYRLLKTTIDRLDEWESNSPIHSSFTSLFQLPSYMKILGQKERLWLGKLLIDRMPTRDGCPPLDVLVICQEAAINIILEYDKGRQVPHLMYFLRADLHLIFQAGVSLLLAVAVKDRLLQRNSLEGSSPLPVHQEDLLLANLPTTSAEEALHLCDDLLQEITEVLEESTLLRDIFHICHGHQRPTHDDVQQRDAALGPFATNFESNDVPTSSRPNQRSPHPLIDPQLAEGAPCIENTQPPSTNWNPLNNMPCFQDAGDGPVDEMQWMTSEVWGALQDEMTQYFSDPSAEFGNWSFY